MAFLRSCLLAECDVECLRVRSSASAASTVSTWLGGARLPIGWSLIEIGGEEVALGGGVDDRVDEIALSSAPRALHRQQCRVDGRAPSPVRSSVSMRAAERRRDLQQVAPSGEMSVDVLAPAPWNSAGLKNTASPLRQRYLHLVGARSGR